MEEGAGHKGSPDSRKRVRPQIILGLVDILRQIPAQHGRRVSPFVHPLTERCQVEVGRERAARSLLTADTLLVPFNPDLPSLVMCDASSYGIGAELAHRMPDGDERPIGYASRSLSKAERNYSQIERSFGVGFRGQKIPFVRVWSWF